MKRFRTIIIAATVLTVFTIACGGQDPVTTGDTEGDATTTSSIPALNPLTVSLTLDQTSRVVRVISGEGGTLDTTTSNGARYSLEIPQGALLAPTAVTLTPVDSVDGLPVGADALAAVHFSPEGLEFQQPTTVTVDLPAGFNPSEVIGFSFVGGGGEVGRSRCLAV